MTAGRSFGDPSGGPALAHDRHGTDLAAMEAAAIDVLEALPDSMWDATPPVPIEAIAEERFGLIVIETDDPAGIPGAPPVPEGAHFSGMLIADRGEIWVNASDAREWPPRRRFTIAHELGHFVLHRHSVDPTLYQAADVAALTDREASGGGIRSSVDPEAVKVLPRIEAEAHAFAAALLLPAFLLRPAFSEVGGDLARLQETFASSKAALERRLRTLGLTTA